MHALRSLSKHLFLGWMVIMTQTSGAAEAPQPTGQADVRLHVVFNNLPYRQGLATGWGFACLVEMSDKTVLFDTGGDGDILLSNLRDMGLDPARVEAVVLSHNHGDHTGGLERFLERNPNVVVYVPASFPAAFHAEVLRHGARLETVNGPRPLLDGIHSTGEMGEGTREQGLIVDSPQGAILITGCAHPDVADMVEQARVYLGRDIQLVMGGFHLGSSSDRHIQAVIQRLRELGVQQVAPSHCTGGRAIDLFRAAWGAGFIDGGLGAVIELPGGYP